MAREFAALPPRPRSPLRIATAMRSLGVITMGTPHKNRVEEALLAARAFRPELDEFFARAATREPFFVKNLERVQGDERDAIILSIGYGKGTDGMMRYNFGPVNKPGGERRLNVAITRAKNALTLVSTFTGDEMDESKCRTTGMAMMRRYTLFAARGGELDRTSLAAAEINPFEQDILDALTKRGMNLEAQYGVSGYRIDFVARNPTNLARFALAIECDGASYHSAESARDRDRLRQEHLERLGWRFHRIWSTEWWRNKPAEVERAWAALEAAVADADTAQPVTAVPLADNAARKVELPVRPPRPTIRTGLPIDAYSATDILRVIDWVASDGMLRSREEMLREVMRFLGFNRRGARIVERLGTVIAERLP
jgi:very-short-patch-repair endonuclease